MRSVTMRLLVAGMQPDQAYERVSCFEDYPKHTRTVREVDVTESTELGSHSKWEVNFRDGIMRWQEQDQYFPEERRIEFTATGGDLDMFVGSWSVDEAPEGSLITFQADFDLGLTTLNEMVEPIADEALRETIDQILDGLTDGRSKIIEGGAPSSVARS